MPAGGWYIRKSGAQAGKRLTPCKACRLKYYRETKAADPERYREYSRKSRENTRGIENSSLKHRHGITLEQYEAMLLKQGGLCVICREPPETTKLHVDHDHKCCPGSRSCGQCVRSLLCFRCNAALGSLRDRPDLAIAAANYLTLRVRHFPGVRE